jgi:hypothetical protein
MAMLQPGKEVTEYKKNNPDMIEREPAMDKLKYIEMQLNKKDMLLDKAKMVCVKLDKIFMIIPYTISKIEIRMRNILLNNRQILDGISHFMSFYLVTQQFQARMMASYTAHLKEQ